MVTEREERDGGRLRMLVLTPILPFPGASGQEQRVRYSLEAARALFHVTVATYAPRGQQERVRAELSGYCDAAIVLPALYSRSRGEQFIHRIRGAAVSAWTGVKRTNYEVGEVEFSPSRVRSELGGLPFDCVLFEYWYAARATSVFRDRGIPCVLDMHNILWRAYERQLRRVRWLPGGLKRWAAARYRRREEESWRRFDGLVAINREEEADVRDPASSPGTRVFYAPMGIDLARWPYQWQPGKPVRVGFYGALGSLENQEGAFRCHEKIMPRIWERFPDAELWFVGVNPPASLLALTRDPRVRVTGFVPDAGKVLATMFCVVCPWSGTYGFRSRLVEVMSVGAPVVASRDAVSGMELEHGKGVLLADDDEGLARLVNGLLENVPFAQEQSRLGRARVEELFSVEKTYGRWMREMSEWLHRRGEPVRASGGLRS
jgi:glycosyltransferase involved in cell wall biosynthesis